MNSSPNNIYSPLAKGSFRLLTIISSDSPSIICELQHFSFDKALEYIAISYSWGKPDTSASIICNGSSFPVTPHLFGALHQLHSFAPQANIWIDAICINQQDNAEKAVQTRKMNNFYRSAKQVFVWLGQAVDNSDLALQEIATLNQKLEIILQEDTVERTAYIKDWLGNGDLTSSGLPGTKDTIWRSLGHIYSRTWFTRLWIIQEVALAKHIVVAYGNVQIEWDSLLTLANRLSRANLLDLIGCHSNNAQRIRKSIQALSMSNVARRYQNVGFFGIPPLMRIGRDRDVTEPVDKIYGILGLLDPIVASQIVVDYSPHAREHWWNTYIQYSKLQFRSEGTLLLLSMAASEYKPPELPSWCPNFNSTPKDPFSFVGVAGYRAGFRSIEDRVNSHVRTVPDSNRLEFLGFRVDSVKNVVGSPQHCFEASERKGPSGAAALLLEHEAKCLQVSQEIFNSPNEVPEAHWRTLIADTNILSKSPVDSVVLEDYLQTKKVWISHRDQASPDYVDSLTASERQGSLSFYQSIEMKSSRTFFCTNGGRVGLGPSDLEVGDVICVLYGAAPLFVLRFSGGEEVARLVGDTFVSGLMDMKSIASEDRGEDEYFTIS